ncbi:MAG TPA: hypothetical protein DDY13_10045 [Cytophagales bacterium]|jgi:uncharacterized protein YebE (UPF0316 family)|nr:hypothetical protein [Cytophagales bacterium]
MDIAKFLGFDDQLFSWVVLPLIIFFARIADVSINTIRVIYMLGGRRILSSFLGFLEAFIWLIVISQILQHLENYISYLAYAGGFAAGIYVGMLIEEKIAFGNVIVRVITQKDASNLIASLRNNSFRVTTIDAEDNKGPVSVLFLIVARQQITRLTQIVEKNNPQAIFSIESVKSVRDMQEVMIKPEKKGYAIFKTFMRK